MVYHIKKWYGWVIDLKSKLLLPKTHTNYNYVLENDKERVNKTHFPLWW